MLPTGVILLCNTLLFLTLLADRYRIFATLLVSGAAFVLSLALSPIFSLVFDAPAAQTYGKVILNLVILYAASLFIFKNNPLQKLFLSVFCFANFVFSDLFTTLLLGTLPLNTAGVPGALVTILGYLLISLLFGLCFRAPFTYFSDRAPSGFFLGITLIMLLPILLCTGHVDFLFPFSPYYLRVLCALIVFVLVVFMLRSLYYAAKFREETTRLATKAEFSRIQQRQYQALLRSIQELQAIHNRSNFLLSTVTVMAKDGNGESIPAYLNLQKTHQQPSELLTVHTDEPSLNAVLVSAAMDANAADIHFESNVVPHGALPISLLCLATHELLAKAQDAAMESSQAYKKIRYTMSPGPDTLTLEVVYPAVAPQVQKLEIKGKSLSQLLTYFFSDPPAKAEAAELPQTLALIEQYSGSIHEAIAGNDAILTVTVHC